MRKLIVAMTGASGAILGVRLLGALRDLEVESHLILSDWAVRTIELETTYTPDQVRQLADKVYDYRDMSACISSGSFLTDGMLVVPCSMKTLSAIANGYSENLIARAAEVCIKEGRRLAIMPRETPLNQIHLRHMLSLSQMGVGIIPPSVSFYHHPQTLDDMVNQLVGKALDYMGVEHQLYSRWNG